MFPFLITNYESDVLGLYDCLGEYAGLDELNYLAHLLEGMNENEIEKFKAAFAFGNHTDGAGDLFNLAQNPDCFDFYPGMEEEEGLGRYFAEEMRLIDIPEHIRGYFDYEAYGRDIDLNGIGGFVPGGYLCESGERLSSIIPDGRTSPRNTALPGRLPGMRRKSPALS